MRATDEHAQEVEPGGLDLPAIERKVAARWAESDILGKSLARTASGPVWSCYTQPSAATGVPGIGYARTRAAADLYARFKTMQGMAVPRGHGWDCHGLGVEVAVAHELGLSGPRLPEIGLPDVGLSRVGLSQTGLSRVGLSQVGLSRIGKSRSGKSGNRKSELGLSEVEEIERYGVERFVARCRESALRHASAFAAVAERLGCLTDPRKIFYTMDRSYIESVWWSLKQIFDAGLLVKDYRIGRYCPRCRTPLAEHEVRGPQVFKKVTGTSVIVRLPIERPPGRAAIREHLSGADLLSWTATPWMLAANTAAAVHPDASYVVARKSGHGDKVVLADAGFARVLGEGWHIVAKLTGAELTGTAYRRPFALAEAQDDGTGLVEADRAVRAYAGTGVAQMAAAYGGSELPASPANAIDPIGEDGCFGPEAGSLNGLFFANADAAVAADLADRGLLFSAAPIRRIQPHCWRCGTPVLTRAMAAWYIRTSEMRDRLAGDAGVVTPRPGAPSQRLGLGADEADWAVGRTRYWGVPLPIWECARDHLTCAGSLAELSELAGSDLLGLDPHRPAIDDVVIGCRSCGGPAYRVAETLDASYDTGAVPFALGGARPGESDSVAAGRPTSLAIEGGGNARDWCDAMTVIAALCDRRAPFDRAISPGRALDERGRVMGGRQGNQADPTALIERHGADAIRWHFAGATPERPGANVTEAAIGRIRRRVLGAYLASALFFAEQADQAEARAPWLNGAILPVDDRPVLDRWLLSELHSAVSEVSEGLEAFRSDVAARRIERLIADLAGWYLRLSGRRLADVADVGQAAVVLRTLRHCLDVLTRLMAPIAPHLSDHVWNLIRHKNAPSSVHLATWPTALTALVDERLNEQMTRVRGIVGVGKAARAASMIGSWQPLTTARLACEGGAEFTPELLMLIAEELNVENVEPVATVPDAAGSPRWLVASKQAGTVALEVVITPRLRLEGIAKRSIRLIKQARQRIGLRIGDLVDVGWTTGDDEVGAALTEFSPMISQAVGATGFHQLSSGFGPGAGAIEHASPELGATFWLTPLPRT
jgi:isoleucyl-tRNA synthetase